MFVFLVSFDSLNMKCCFSNAAFWCPVVLRLHSREEPGNEANCLGLWPSTWNAAFQCPMVLKLQHSGEYSLGTRLTVWARDIQYCHKGKSQSLPGEFPVVITSTYTKDCGSNGEGGLPCLSKNFNYVHIRVWRLTKISKMMISTKMMSPTRTDTM